MAEDRTRLYRPSERDWPTLMHIVIAARRKAGTTAWARYVDTTPPNPQRDRLYASYTASEWHQGFTDQRGIVDTLLGALERQRQIVLLRNE